MCSSHIARHALRLAGLFACLLFFVPIAFGQGNGNNSGGGSSSGGGGGIPPELSARLDLMEENVLAQLETMQGELEAAAEIRISALEDNLIARAEDRIAALESQLTNDANHRIDELLTDLEARMDDQDLRLETIVGNTTSWPALTASLCFDLGTSRDLSGGLSVGAEVGAESGGGIDFYGNKAEADASVALGTDVALTGGYSIGLSPSTCIELPAFELDGFENPVPTSLTQVISLLEDYRDGFATVAGSAASAFGSLSGAASVGTGLVTTPSFASDPSVLVSSASSAASDFASLFPIGQELEDLLADPASSLASEPDLCSTKDIFPAGSPMRQKYDAFCANLSDPAADLDALLAIQDIVAEIDMVTSESAPAMIASLVTKVDANSSALGTVANGVNNIENNLNFQFSTNDGALRWQIDRNLNTDLGGVRNEVLQIKDKVFNELNNDIRSAQSQIVSAIRSSLSVKTVTDDDGLDMQSHGTLELNEGRMRPEDKRGVPDDYKLESAYPNPFNPRTTVEFALPRADHVTITLFDIMGRRVQSLVSGRMEAGYHSVNLDATRLASGTYFYRMEAGDYVESRQIQLVK